MYWFWGHLIWVPKFKKGRKRITNILHKNEELSSVTLFSKLNIESNHTNVVKRTKNYQSTIIFLCFCKYLNRTAGTSCCEFWAIFKISSFGANYGGASGWLLTWHNSTDTQIRALDHPPEIQSLTWTLHWRSQNSQPASTFLICLLKSRKNIIPVPAFKVLKVFCSSFERP